MHNAARTHTHMQVHSLVYNGSGSSSPMGVMDHKLYNADSNRNTTQQIFARAAYGNNKNNESKQEKCSN